MREIEVYTPRGWVNPKSIQNGDIIYRVTPDTTVKRYKIISVGYNQNKTTYAVNGEGYRTFCFENGNILAGVDTLFRFFNMSLKELSVNAQSRQFYIPCTGNFEDGIDATYEQIKDWVQYGILTLSAQSLTRSKSEQLLEIWSEIYGDLVAVDSNTIKCLQTIALRAGYFSRILFESGKFKLVTLNRFSVAINTINENVNEAFELLDESQTIHCIVRDRQKGEIWIS